MSKNEKKVTYPGGDSLLSPLGQISFKKIFFWVGVPLDLNLNIVDRQTDEPTDRHLLSRAPMGLKMVKIVKLVKNIIIYNHFTY